MQPLIDPEGMFGGDRIAGLDDTAKLHWPWIYLASNGHGRIEINYRKLVARVYGSFRTAPGEEQLMKIFRSYADNFLLFVYRHREQIWGQWDTPVKYLPSYKTRADQASPVPPPREYQAWLAAYSQRKQLLATQAFDVISEGFSKHFQNSSEMFRDRIEEEEEEDGEVVTEKEQEFVVVPCAVAERRPERSGGGTAAVSGNLFLNDPIREQAAHIVHRLAHRHPVPGPVKATIAAAADILRAAKDPGRCAGKLQTSHEAYLPYWAAEREHNPAAFVPQLLRWLTDGDWMHPPQSIRRKPPERVGEQKSVRKTAWEKA